MATKSFAWQTGSGNITLNYQGQGDGPISVVSDANDIGSARSQVITIETTRGGLVTKNVIITQGACPVPVGTVLNYSYTGSYQEIELPAGQYKLQCWGAQGGSNAAASSYGITAQAGGKGGYSEGVITLSQKTTVRVYVGGQGSSSAGGFNGGGSTTGSASYNSGNEQGVSRMGGGGGATDIRLSDGALLSRMIVAGGGSGGAMVYKAVTEEVPTETLVKTLVCPYSYTSGSNNIFGDLSAAVPELEFGKTYKIVWSDSRFTFYWIQRGSNDSGQGQGFVNSSGDTFTNNKVTQWSVKTCCGGISTSVSSGSVTFYIYEIGSTTRTIESRESQVGFVGGGTTGGGYSSTYKGKQNAAGTGGSFGPGANQSVTNYRYCSGAGGGGWYGGGGGQKSDSSMTYCKYSGGGSGWVNTSASAGNRPSGYTGLQLDSGTTKDGTQSFEAPGTVGSASSNSSGTTSCTIGVVYKNDSSVIKFLDWYIPKTTMNLAGKTVRIIIKGSFVAAAIGTRKSDYSWINTQQGITSSVFTYTFDTNANTAMYNVSIRTNSSDGYFNGTIEMDIVGNNETGHSGNGYARITRL